MKGLLILVLALLVLISFSAGCRIFEPDVKIARHELAECVLQGTATNVGRITAEDVKLYATFTDQNKEPVGFRLMYSVGELRERESADFLFVVPQEYCNSIDDYNVWAEWAE
jgi:hypothetical protein